MSRRIAGVVPSGAQHSPIFLVERAQWLWRGGPFHLARDLRRHCHDVGAALQRVVIGVVSRGSLVAV